MRRRFVAPVVGGEPWTPADAVFAAWYDASDLSTRTTDGSGVIALADKTANGIDITTGGTGGLGSDTVNSLDTITFDGGSDVLKGDKPLTGLEQGDVYIVIKAKSGTNGPFLNETVNAYSFTSQSGSSNTVLTQQILVSDFYLNGAASGWVTRGNIYTDIVNNVQIVELLGIDLYSTSELRYCYYSSSFRFMCEFCEVIWHQGTTTLSNRQKVEGYLAWKWQGDGDSLPIGHPYKLAPPTT